MAFSESTKRQVKRKADLTCCWCRERCNKVEVHHIIPEAEGGPDDEDNAAPLCGACHDLYGGNPDLRKEIRLRRDQWFEICSKILNPEYGWPIGLDVPLLDFAQEIAPTNSIATKGIQFTDKDPTDANNPPLLYLSVYFKRSRYFGQHLPPRNERWLYLEANMRFAFNLRTQVRAWNERDVSALMGFLSNKDKYLPEFVRTASDELLEQYLRDRERGWNLRGPAPDNSEHGYGDYFRVWWENGENRLMISTFTPTHAGISVHARFSNKVATAFADYLEEVGFIESFDKSP
jgi:hypothetical protein